MRQDSLTSFAGTWSTIFSLAEETEITKSNLLTTLSVLKKEWRVSFNFKANTNLSALTQIFHMTIGGKGIGEGSKYGDRTPAIWIHKTKGLLISSGVGGKISYVTWSKPVPTPGQWVTVEIGQEKVPTRRVSQGYVIKFSITVDGTRKRYVTNSNPSDFENVKVYASSPWFNAVNGAIKNLLIETKLDGRC